MNKDRKGISLWGGILSACLLFALPKGVWAQKQKTPVATASATAPLTISRANLAKNASFTVTQTLAPKGGEKIVRSYTVSVKGDKARMDYEDPSLGVVRYIANEKGIFFFIPSNKSAMKQSLKGGVEGALKVAFAQYATQLAGAKKVGVATVSGQPTTMYKDEKTGAVICLGMRPGFRLPVKAVIANEGGTSTFLVTNIKLDVSVKDDIFVLPKGTQIIESSGSPQGIPGGATP